MIRMKMCSRSVNLCLMCLRTSSSYKGCWDPVFSFELKLLAVFRKPAFVVTQNRSLSNSAFNLSDIVKDNAKAKPNKSVGTTSSKQLNKSTADRIKKKDLDTPNSGETLIDESGKTKKTKRQPETDSAQSTENLDDNNNPKVQNEEIDIGKRPDCNIVDTVPANIEALLNIPLILDKMVDTNRCEEFEEFIEDLELSYLPSVNSIINLTKSPEQIKRLERWKDKMVKELGGEVQFSKYKRGILCPFLHAGESHDFQGFKMADTIENLSIQRRLWRVCTFAQAHLSLRPGTEISCAASNHDLCTVYKNSECCGFLDNGASLRECIYSKLSGNPDETQLRQGNEGHLESISKVLPDISDVIFMEEECVHPELFYRGKFDCIAKYRGTLCLIGWVFKTSASANAKPLLRNTYDTPLKIAAYLGAVNRSNMLKKQGIYQLTRGAVVIAYTDGEPATVHAMNREQCERYWKLWVKRLLSFWLSKYHKMTAI